MACVSELQDMVFLNSGFLFFPSSASFQLPGEAALPYSDLLGSRGTKVPAVRVQDSVRGAGLHAMLSHRQLQSCSCCTSSVLQLF